MQMWLPTRSQNSSSFASMGLWNEHNGSDIARFWASSVVGGQKKRGGKLLEGRDSKL